MASVDLRFESLSGRMGLFLGNGDVPPSLLVFYVVRNDPPRGEKVRVAMIVGPGQGSGVDNMTGAFANLVTWLLYGCSNYWPPCGNREVSVE